MYLEKFLSGRLTKKQMEGLNVNSKTERMEKDKEDKKLIITLPNELVDMINSVDRGKNILRSNLVEFMRSLKSDLEFQKSITV
ncbi:hypothetical protein [uncultured Clostridium sp.]|uniref:hypothetical protein n=1 Tax=uncultured Clostridium sp. TaxID=59620 RepID=UPI0025945F0D|nr:hypothetical protein [uncultured Clostridium sp.]